MRHDSWASVRRIAVALLAWSSAGCASGDSGPATTALPDGTITLSHTGLISDSLRGTLVLATPAIGDPRFMALTGTTLWISDRSGNPSLHLVDLAADSLLDSRGRAGEGPGDYGEVPSSKVEWNYYVGCSATEAYLYGLFAGQRIDGADAS